MIPCSKPEIMETQEELMAMPRSVVIANLTDRQITFCEEYTKSNNIRLAAKRAGLSEKSGHSLAWKIRMRPECARYIAWLKSFVVQETMLKGAELVDQYMRIAFADITDFITQEPNGKIKIKSINDIDGQVVQKINQNHNGITIELHDKNKALDKLEQYFEFMPRGWKYEIETQRIDILKQRLEVERLKAGQNEVNMTDDGFIEAMIGVAEEVWDDETEAEEN